MYRVYDTAYRIQRYTAIQCIGCITTPQVKIGRGFAFCRKTLWNWMEDSRPLAVAPSVMCLAAPAAAARAVRVVLCASRHCKPTSWTTSPDAPEWLERVAASAVDV